MEFEYCDSYKVEAEGLWDLDTLASAWDGLEGLMDDLNEKYRNHTLSEKKPHELHYRIGYPNLHRFGQVLITNSRDSIHIKTIREGSYLGRIDINLSVSENELKVAIEDNGAGINQEIEPYLFTPLIDAPISDHLLKQNMNKRMSLAGKMGDDLRQVKGGVEELGGQVFYENKGHNVGAIFGYTIPISSLRVSLDPNE